MFTGNYRDFAGKSECGDFKFMGIACIPAIPVILKSPHSDFHVKIVGVPVNPCKHLQCTSSRSRSMLHNNQQTTEELRHSFF